MLATLAHRKPRSWDLILPHAISAYNTSFNAVIGNTPFFLMFGRDPFAWKHDGLLPRDVDEGDIRTRVERLRTARTWAKNLLNKHQKKNREYYNSRLNPSPTAEGDVVMVKIPTPSGPVRKLAPNYAGPYRVRRILGSVLWIVPVAFPGQPERQVHMDRTRPCDANRLIDANLEELNKPWGIGPADVDPNLEPEDTQ
jgi:hypothetical protein